MRKLTVEPCLIATQGLQYSHQRRNTARADVEIQMNFFKRNLTLLLPLLSLIVSGIFLWGGFHDGQLSRYLGSLGFAGLALTFYLTHRSNRRD